MKDIVSFIGIIIPMITIAGSAVAFVWNAFRESKLRRENRLFDLMKLIDEKGSIASKTLAVYQLRDYPEHKGFIVRFCEVQQANITGNSAKILADEMELTKKSFQNS